MDGRLKRLCESLEKNGKDCEAEIPKLTNFFQDEEKGLWDDKPSREKTKKAVTNLQKEAAKLATNQKLALRRFNTASASGQAAATKARDMIDSNIDFLGLIQHFLTLLLLPQPPLDEFNTAMDDMTSRGVRFTKRMYKYAYWLKARSLMLFARYDELCIMSTSAGNASGGELDASGDADLQKQIDCNMPRADVLAYASMVLQQCMSERINGLNDAQVGLPLSEYPEKKAVLAMFEEIKSKCVVDGFAGVDGLPSMKQWTDVLDLQRADPDVLSQLVKDYVSPEDDFEPNDILAQLLYTTKLGNRLLDCAVHWQQDEGDTIEASRLVSKVDSMVEQLLRNKANIADMAFDADAPETDYIIFFNVHVGPIETLVEKVFAHESVSDKVALKQKQEAKVFAQKTLGSPNRLVGLCPERIIRVCKRVHK